MRTHARIGGAVRGRGASPLVVGAALAAVLLLPMASPALAQGVRELTVDECVRLGLAKNATLRAAAADVAAARASYDQVRAGRLPTIRAQGGYTRLSDNVPAVEYTLPGTDSTFLLQAVELNRFSAQLSVEQPLFTGLRLRHQVRAAAREAEATALDAKQARADVALEIRRAFWSLVRARALQESLRLAVGDVDAHVRDVRNRVTAGTALLKDLLAAQTRRSEVLLQRVEADNDVRIGQLDLNRLIGLPLNTAVRPVARIALDGSPDDSAAIALDSSAVPASSKGVPLRSGGLALDSLGMPPDTATLALDSAGVPPGGIGALAGQPRLEALTARVQASRAQLRAARGARWPQLSLVGSYIYGRPNPYFFLEPDRFRYAWDLGLSVSWDPWQGGRVGASVAEARARLQAAEARLTDTRQQVEVEIARQRLEVQRAAEAVDAARSNVVAARESFRVARQQYDEQAALSSDVLAAEQAYRRAEARYAGATADHAIARATLLDVLGRVW